MSDHNDTNAKADWLRKLYEEAWKQYSHEDNLGQSRTNFFMGIQAGLLGFLAAVSKPIYDIGTLRVAGIEIHLGLALIGLFMAVFGAFSLIVSVNWQEVTEAGKQYVRLRWATVAAIEIQAGIDRTIGLATIEAGWRAHNLDEPYRPFPMLEQLRQLELPPPQRNEGWGSMLQVIRLWQGVCILMMAIGLLLFCLALFAAHKSPV